MATASLKKRQPSCSRSASTASRVPRAAPLASREDEAYLRFVFELNAEHGGSGSAAFFVADTSDAERLVLVAKVHSWVLQLVQQPRSSSGHPLHRV